MRYVDFIVAGILAVTGIVCMLNGANYGIIFIATAAIMLLLTEKC